MAWCRQATSHYLNQFWLSSVASLGHNELRSLCTILILLQWTMLWWDFCVDVHVMWCDQVIVPWLINTLRPRRNGQHFADNIFKRIFFNENVIIYIKISLKFLQKGPINNIPALVQIMAWRWWGDKPLSEPVMVILLRHICVTRPQWLNITCWDSVMQGSFFFVYIYMYVSI